MLMVCPTVAKMLQNAEDEMETSIMLRLQKEGLSPKLGQSLYRIVMAGEYAPKRNAAIIESLSYEQRREGKPDLCVGTPCMEDRASYVQYWNEDRSAVFISKEMLAFSPQSVMGCGMRLINAMPRVSGRLNVAGVLYFLGSEKAAQEMAATVEPVKCPKTGKDCDNRPKLYQVMNFMPTLDRMFGKRDNMTAYMKIINEEAVKYDKAVEDYCLSVCNKTGC